MGLPIPPSPVASQALLTAFAERGIDWHPNQRVTSLTADRKVALLSDGGEMPYDLFLGVPAIRAPKLLEDSGMTEAKFVPVFILNRQHSKNWTSGVHQT